MLKFAEQNSGATIGTPRSSSNNELIDFSSYLFVESPEESTQESIF